MQVWVDFVGWLHTEMVHCMLVVCLVVRVVRAIMGLHTHSSRLHKASMPERLSRLLNCRQPQLLKNLRSYGKTTRNRLRRCVYLRVCVCLSVCLFVLLSVCLGVIRQVCWRNYQRSWTVVSHSYWRTYTAMGRLQETGWGGVYICTP